LVRINSANNGLIMDNNGYITFDNTSNIN
jgi:hypothetical protein